MNTIDRLQQNQRIDLLQLALSAVGAPVLLFAIVQSARREVASGETLVLALTFVAFLARVRYPEIALMAQVIFAIYLARFLDTSSDAVGRAVLAVCLFSVALTRERLTVVVSTIVVLATTFGIAWHYGLDNPGTSASRTDYLALIAQAAAAVGVGTAIRIQRRYIAEIRDRADRERRNREIEVRQSITEERLRIARELHDAVAHHIAVVSMFLGLARTTVPTSPEKTEQTLASAQDSTRTVLAELQQILQLLREPIGAGAGDEIEPPVPGLADIEPLLAGFRSAGMPVRMIREGEERPISTQVGLAAYRLVQEALTNANKHGTGPVDLRIAFGAGDLTIIVENAVPAKYERNVVAGAGLGLVGMAERVRLLGGTLEYGESGGVFRVTARLPFVAASSIEQPATNTRSGAQ
jgi:signal transduction histidine kinase